METTKFDWGIVIEPTKKCLVVFGHMKKKDYAMSLGKNKNGNLVLVKFNKRTLESWSPSFWKKKK